jgi:phosphoglycerate kinase
MTDIYTISDIDETTLFDRFVLVRADFNVPITKADGCYIVANDAKIRNSIETVQFLIDHNAKVILCSHLGRPNGEIVETMSLLPVWQHIVHNNIFPGVTIDFVNNCIGNLRCQAMEAMTGGEILMLENLRFHDGEQRNDYDFARWLAHDIDIYVNDAFSVCHRKHASVCAITSHIPVICAGFALNKEFFFLSNMLINFPQRPLAAVIGGAKISTKLELLKQLIKHVDKILIGGAMMYTFFAAAHHSVGDSLIEPSLMTAASELIELAASMETTLHFAPDVVVVKTKSLHNGRIEGLQTIPGRDIPNEMIGLDVGPATIDEFVHELQDCSTILWNGEDQIVHCTDHFSLL